VRTLQSQAMKTRERNTKYNKINWKKAEKHIHKIQLRITKAVKKTTAAQLKLSY